MSATTATPVQHISEDVPGIPFARLVQVELRKMFNTRSGFWLMMSIGIVAVLATTIVMFVVPDEEIKFGTFGTAFGVPMAILLPIIAILSVTSEWSQRTGLVTFTLSPHRASVIGAKAVASVLVGVVSMLIAFGIGAIGNVIGAAVNGVDVVWDFEVTDLVYITLANVFGLLIGFMLGILIRNSAGAIVAYFVYAFVAPSLLAILAAFQDWFEDLQPWIDFNYAQAALFNPGGPTGEEWGQIGSSSLIWFFIPMAFGLWRVLKAEVK